MPLMRHRSKEETDEQVVSARIQIDNAVDKLMKILDDVQEQAIAAKAELDRLRSEHES